MPPIPRYTHTLMDASSDAYACTYSVLAAEQLQQHAASSSSSSSAGFDHKAAVTAAAAALGVRTWPVAPRAVSQAIIAMLRSDAAGRAAKARASTGGVRPAHADASGIEDPYERIQVVFALPLPAASSKTEEDYGGDDDDVDGYKSIHNGGPVGSFSASRQQRPAIPPVTAPAAVSKAAGREEAPQSRFTSLLNVFGLAATQAAVIPAPPVEAIAEASAQSRGRRFRPAVPPDTTPAAPFTTAGSSLRPAAAGARRPSLWNMFTSTSLQTEASAASDAAEDIVEEDSRSESVSSRLPALAMLSMARISMDFRPKPMTPYTADFHCCASALSLTGHGNLRCGSWESRLFTCLHDHAPHLAMSLLCSIAYSRHGLHDQRLHIYDLQLQVGGFV
jgi:hypothetical protein